jgi:thioredoxin 1
MKFFTLVALHVSFSLSLLAAELQPLPYALVKPEIGHGKSVMLEVGSTKCQTCKEMGELLYDEMKLHPDRKIFFINVRADRDAALALKIQLIPTQIVYDPSGKEIDRHIGGFTSDDLKQFLAKHKI